MPDALKELAGRVERAAKRASKPRGWGGVAWRDNPEDDQGPWLIRSHYWNAWHCRRADGGAGGYTQNLEHAGFFDLKTARAYHDEPGGRDEAVPASQVRGELEASLADLDKRRSALLAALSQSEGAEG